MKLLRIAYNTIWFCCHPITGPVSPTDSMPTIYPTWRQAFELARGLVR